MSRAAYHFKALSVVSRNTSIMFEKNLMSRETAGLSFLSFSQVSSEFIDG